MTIYSRDTMTVYQWQWRWNEQWHVTERGETIEVKDMPEHIFG